MGAAMVIGTVVSYYSVLKVSYAHRAPYTGGAGDMRWLTSLLVSAETGDGLDEHRFYGRRWAFHGAVDVAEKGFRVVAAASNRGIQCLVLGLH